MEPGYDRVSTGKQDLERQLDALGRLGTPQWDGSVRYVSRTQNRSAGSDLALFYSAYRILDSDPFSVSTPQG